MISLYLRTMHLKILIFALAVSVSGYAQSVKTRTEKNVDLTVYETFTVVKGEFVTSPENRKVNEEALYKSITAAVKKEMETRGFKYVADSTAQLYVSYVAGSYNLTNAGVNGPLGQTPASNPSDMNQSRTWSKTSEEAMVVIDITDSANKKLLWKAETDDLSLETGDFGRVMDAVIYKAFKKFPNKNKKKKK